MEVKPLIDIGTRGNKLFSVTNLLQKSKRTGVYEEKQILLQCIPKSIRVCTWPAADGSDC